MPACQRLSDGNSSRQLCARSRSRTASPEQTHALISPHRDYLCERTVLTTICSPSCKLKTASDDQKRERFPLCERTVLTTTRSWSCKLKTVSNDQKREKLKSSRLATKVNWKMVFSTAKLLLQDSALIAYLREVVV